MIHTYPTSNCPLTSIVLKSFQLCSSWESLNIANCITNSALFIPSHDIKIKLITLLHSNSRFFFFWKERKKNHARCSKNFKPLPPTKILNCPQCIKAKINSSIKGRSYLKHLNFFFFWLKFLSHLQMLAKTKNKKKGQKEKKNKKKRKLKQIWYNFIRLFQSSRSIPIGRDLQWHSLLLWYNSP